MIAQAVSKSQTSVTASDGRKFEDALAVEEPLEIRVGYGAGGKYVHKAVSITMRTPGDDANLAAGFLFTEGIISSAEQVREIRHCGRKSADNGFPNTIRVELNGGFDLDLKRLERNFYTTSSCGVCGKASIDALATDTRKIESGVTIRAEIIHTLPDKLRAAQAVFESTGGLHASGIFNTNGELIAVAEDVGRHNALDKVIGSAFLNGGVPMSDKVLMVSGRLSFELVQKAVMAGIPIVAAVGAPSSLAVELASEMNLTVTGFVRDSRFNIYCGEERIVSE